MAASTANANHILVTHYKKGNDGGYSSDNTETKGLPVEGAVFDEVGSEHAAAEAGANAKITYPFTGNQPLEFFVEDTVATLVAKANGTVLAS